MKVNVEQLRRQLETALAAGAVAEAESGLESAHSIDGRRPNLVCRPESAEQIAAALRLCTEEEAAIIPWGGGTA